MYELSWQLHLAESLKKDGNENLAGKGDNKSNAFGAFRFLQVINQKFAFHSFDEPPVRRHSCKFKFFVRRELFDCVADVMKPGEIVGVAGAL